MELRCVKITEVTRKLEQLACFLKPYLPFANCHNSNFLVSNHWDMMIPPEIASQLLELNEWQLSLLPAGLLCLCPTPHSADFNCTNTYACDSGEDDTARSHCAVGVNPANDIANILYRRHNSETCVGEDLATKSLVNYENTSLAVCGYTNSDISHSDVPPEWDYSVPPEWQHHSLADFVATAASNTLTQLGVLTSSEELCEMLNLPIHQVAPHVGHAMKVKKSYEVEVMAEFCSRIMKRFDISHAVDIGSGRGYLGCHLSLICQRPVIGIDSSSKNTSSAAVRSRRLHKQWFGLTRRSAHGPTAAQHDSGSCPVTTLDTLSHPSVGVTKCTTSENLFYPITFRIDSQTDLADIFSRTFEPDDEANESNDSRHRVMLTGLHTCGNLSPNILRLFAETTDVDVVCQLGCCYNLLTEKFIRFPGQTPLEQSEDGFPMSEFLCQRNCQIGRNARMLSCHSTPRFAQSNVLPNKSIYWRALLQKVLYDTLGYVRDDWRVGKIPPSCSTFVEYARMALSRLQLATEISDEVLLRYSENFSDMQRRHVAFFSA